MAALELILLLLAVSAALRMIAGRLGVPYPSLLVVGGLVLAFIPGLPRVELPPDVLFLVFVPPLLYWGAVSFPLRDLRQELGPILRLAVLMPLVSIGAVATLAHAMDAAFTWPAAFTLGAVISFPDPVSVLSVLRSLRVARPIESILEGEGLLNDAVGIVAYRMAVAAAVTGAFSPQGAAIQFVLAGGGGVAIGFGVGYVVVRAHLLTRRVPVVENTVSLLTPFASYLGAELVGASGVVAVVATGMYMSRALADIAGPEARLQNRALWTMVTFLLESLVFILVGLELPVITRGLAGYRFPVLLREAALVSLCVVLVRIAWVLPSTYIFRSLGRRVRGSHEPLPPLRWIAFVAWAGLRGGDALVIALALPLSTAAARPFPARQQIVCIAFAVIFATLVLQGPTLRPLARWLRLEGNRREEEEEVHARLTAAEAGLAVLEAEARKESAHPEVVRYVRQRHRQRARRWAAREAEKQRDGTAAADLSHRHLVAAPSHERGALDERRADEYRRLRQRMIKAEQRALVEMRNRGDIPDDVMRRVQRDLDLEALLLGTREPVVEPVSEVPASFD